MLEYLSFTVHSLQSSLDALRRPRISSDSYFECIRSIWSLHDETLNIWTHMIAALIYSTSVLKYIACRKARPASESPALRVFLIGATLCFSLSAIYHTFANHSDAGFWQRLDHLGIATFIWAASSAFSIVCFAKHRLTQKLYTTSVAAFALVSFYQLQRDVTHWSEVSWARLTTHALYGTLASLPALHCASAVAHRSSRAQRQWLMSFAAFIGLNTAGGVIYATEVIERITRVRSAPVGTSHQVMHLLAIAGSWLFKEGIRSFYRGVSTRERRGVDRDMMFGRRSRGVT